MIVGCSLLLRFAVFYSVLRAGTFSMVLAMPDALTRNLKLTDSLTAGTGFAEKRNIVGRILDDL